MKLKHFLMALALAVAVPAGASDQYQFTLTSANPTADTSDPTVGAEVLVPGATYAVWCSNTTSTNVTHVRASVGGTAATTNDVPLGEKIVWDVTLFGDEKRISVLASAGTSTCRVALKKERK